MFKTFQRTKHFDDICHVGLWPPPVRFITQGGLINNLHYGPGKLDHSGTYAREQESLHDNIGHTTTAKAKTPTPSVVNGGRADLREVYKWFISIHNRVLKNPLLNILFIIYRENRVR